jgi:hypothetical protein
VYSDQDTLEHPIDVTAVAMIANGILYVALNIDPLAGHETDKNAYGVKKVKVFTSEQSVNVLERTVEIVPPRGTRFPSLPPASKESKEEELVSNLDLNFIGAGEEKVRGNRRSIDFSEDSSDDDDSDGDMGDDDDDGESDSSGDSEGDQDLALFLVETGKLARSPVPALRRRSLDSLTGSLLGLKTPTRSQGTNTSLYYTGYQSKYMLGGVSQSDMKSSGEDVDMSLPDCSCRRIRCFDLEEVKSVTCSSTSFVLQRGCDAVAFTGSLQSTISESILDAKFFIVGDTSFQWTRSAAASG